MTSGFRCDAEDEPRNELSLPCRHAGTVLLGPDGVSSREEVWVLCAVR